jgi:hypothetical protein
MFPQPWSPTSAYPHPLSSIHDKRFYFSPTAPKKLGNKKLSAKEESSKKESIMSKFVNSASGGSAGSFDANKHVDEHGRESTQMTNKEFALYYDVRLTNRLSYKVADEFVWMGMRHMTNKFRVDLQVKK